MSRTNKIKALQSLATGNKRLFKELIGPEPIKGMIIIAGGKNGIYQVLYKDRTTIYPERTMNSQQLEEFKRNPTKYL